MAEEASEHEHNSIIVNGQPKSVSSRSVTWTEVVDLAYPGQRGDTDLTFIVTYSDADQKPSNGLLAEGGTVHIEKEGTVFNVASRRRS